MVLHVTPQRGAPRDVCVSLDEAERLTGFRPDLPPPAGPVTYVVRREGWIKVGVTTSLNARMRQLSYPGVVATPADMDERQPLELLRVHEGDREQELHTALHRWRVRGEWFDVEALGALA